MKRWKIRKQYYEYVLSKIAKQYILQLVAEQGCKEKYEDGESEETSPKLSIVNALDAHF